MGGGGCEDPSCSDLLSAFIGEGKAKWTSKIKYGLILVMHQAGGPASSPRVHVISVTGRSAARISGRSKGFVRFATISQLMLTRTAAVGEVATLHGLPFLLFLPNYLALGGGFL